VYAVVYADTGQVVALRRTEAAARRVAETRKAGGKLIVKKEMSREHKRGSQQGFVDRAE
jgi:hypothetical protein